VSLRAGVTLSLKPPAVQFDLVRRVEALGFESVWAGDHVSFHGPIHESLTLLATYVPITSRIKLGTAVYLLALRAPAIAAKVTATLDALSGGRLIFGVGVGGENPKEFELCGVPHRERGARVTEGIDVVRTLWRDSPASFKGRFTRFDNVSIDPRPVQQPGPPIWIGGRSDAALTRAGRQGDGWISYVVQPERYGQSVEKIRAAAAAAGRRLDGFAFSHLAFITLGRDWESAKAVWVKHPPGATPRTSSRWPASTGSSARPSSAPSSSGGSRRPAATTWSSTSSASPRTRASSSSASRRTSSPDSARSRCRPRPATAGRESPRSAA
jgi:probable F420-dependent oxidoreductase